MYKMNCEDGVLDEMYSLNHFTCRLLSICLAS